MSTQFLTTLFQVNKHIYELLLLVSNRLLLQWFVGPTKHEGATITYPYSLKTVYSVQMAELKDYSATTTDRGTREAYVQQVTNTSLKYYTASKAVKHFLVVGI